jgi:hypothetical protein
MIKMNKMSQPEQRKMLKALNKAADYTKDGMSPDEALTKVAKEHDLNGPKIERLCEAYNKANAVAYMKSAPSDKRAENYPIAKVANVIENIFGIQEKAAEEITFSKRNYAEEGFVPVEKPMDKAASEKERRSNISPQSIAASMEIMKGQLERLEKRANDNRMRAERDVKNALNDLTAEVQRVPSTESGRKKLNKIAQIVVDAFGEEEGHIVINATNANIDDPTRYMPCLEKKAQAVVMPNDSMFNKVKDLLEKRAHMLKMQKIAVDAEQMANEQALAAAVSPKFNPLIRMVGDLPGLTGSPTDPHMDVATGMTGEWDAYAKDLKSRRLLYDMMLNDEEISAYSPRDVQRTYNDIVETFPELADKRKILRAILRKSLAQGGNMDIYEIKDLISTGKESISRDESIAKAKQQLADNILASPTVSSDRIIQSVPIQIGSGE